MNLLDIKRAVVSNTSMLSALEELVHAQGKQIDDLIAEIATLKEKTHEKRPYKRRDRSEDRAG